MKKLTLLIAMSFLMSPLLNAAEDNGCHNLAVAYADGQEGTGEQYAGDYMYAYDSCVAYEELNEEEIIHP